MEEYRKLALQRSVQAFRLPKYEEIPELGLYLDQAVKYVAQYFAPLQSVSLTASMVRNYVKQKLIPNPEKKLYYRDQIAYLFFIATAKTVLSLEDLQVFIELQRKTYDMKTAYNYFCMEFENILFYVFGVKDTLDEVGVDSTDEKAILRNIIVTVAHKVYLEKCLRVLQDQALN